MPEGRDLASTTGHQPPAPMPPHGVKDHTTTGVTAGGVGEGRRWWERERGEYCSPHSLRPVLLPSDD